MLTNAPLGILISIAVSTTFFVVAGMCVLWPMNAETTRAHAQREDFRPAVDEIVVATAQLCGLGGLVTLVILGGSDAGPGINALTLFAVFMSWGGLQMLYSARYALEYFGTRTPSGIDFNTETAPSYRDFLYFGFSVGMTLGVTDSAVSTTEIRSIVFRHSVLSYVFNAVILASTINLVVDAFTG